MNKKLIYPLFIPLILIGIFILYIRFEYIGKYFIPFIISIINTIFIFFYIIYNWDKNKIAINIFLFYYILTLKFPLIYNCLKYNSIELDSYYGSISDYLTEVNILIFLFDILCLIFYSLFKFKNTLKWIYKIKSIGVKPIFVILFIFLISLISKLYLIQTEVWFFYEMNDIDYTKIPFVSLAFMLEKLDIIIFLYYVFKSKNRDFSKADIIIVFILVFISLFLAIISTSKGRVLTLLFPIFLMGYYSSYKKIAIIVSLIGLVGINQFFDYMMFLRLNPEISVIDGFNKYYSTNNSSKKSIKENKFISRIEYQSVLAKTLNSYNNDFFIENEKVPFGYLQNIIGVIPRSIWSDKPILGVDTNLIGREIKILNMSDTYTTIGLTPLGIAYYMYGYIGILFISALSGILLKFINSIIIEEYWLGFLLSFTLGITVARNGTFVNVIPSLVQMLFVCILFGILLNKKNEKKYIRRSY